MHILCIYYVYLCIYVVLLLCHLLYKILYIYIYIERERERDSYIFRHIFHRIPTDFAQNPYVFPTESLQISHRIPTVEVNLQYIPVFSRKSDGFSDGNLEFQNQNLQISLFGGLPELPVHPDRSVSAAQYDTFQRGARIFYLGPKSIKRVSKTSKNIKIPQHPPS